ncbi:MAG: DUF4056 domain-containing protein [Verrucomicrobiaceae bacterium]|nr:MAG: DUF4056 domain-containing protein [Verrucomicrobiaceae bacterium]
MRFEIHREFPRFGNPPRGGAIATRSTDPGEWRKRPPLPGAESLRTAARTLPAILLLALSGCTAVSPSTFCPEDAAGRTDSGYSPFTSIPKGRVGAMPCPGPFTFYVSADPGKLGTHAYSSALPVANGETARGIVYTLHGGFIDIAHLRKAADWTAYHQVRFRHALEEGRKCMVLPGKEGGSYHISFRYPSSWSGMDAAEKKAVMDELSVRLAQRLAIVQTEWHEIATWYGYSSTPFPEKQSAFTYDDPVSHMVGTKVAGMALRKGSGNYDASVTWFLKQELDRLGAVSPAETERAIAVVKDKWWHNGQMLHRQLDIGSTDGEVRPWIVPGFPNGKTMAGEVFRVPTLDPVSGQDFRNFAQVEIDPGLSAWRNMRRVLPGNPDRCRPAEHFPILMAHIRQAEEMPPSPRTTR